MPAEPDTSARVLLGLRAIHAAPRRSIDMTPPRTAARCHPERTPMSAGTLVTGLAGMLREPRAARVARVARLERAAARARVRHARRVRFRRTGARALDANLHGQHKGAPRIDMKTVFIHGPTGRKGRKIDGATEPFVDETRMGLS